MACIVAFAAGFVAAAFAAERWGSIVVDFLDCSGFAGLQGYFCNAFLRALFFRNGDITVLDGVVVDFALASFAVVATLVVEAFVAKFAVGLEVAKFVVGAEIAMFVVVAVATFVAAVVVAIPVVGVANFAVCFVATLFVGEPTASFVVVFAQVCFPGICLRVVSTLCFVV